ncbi:ThuA domain-containing protein [Paenibacillus humicola]|uniref:ThuA domain-containing protein n=1 Tax=Paenibacillus humicola TaxID=3110540 RepID=UPI00237AC2C7|nr:ThuA domain-containing protein [Paenibacillus humicola]
MKHIAAIVGDYYHDPALIRESMAGALAPFEQAGRIRLTFHGVEQFESVLLSDPRPDVFILFKENRLNPADAQVNEWMTAAAEETACRFVEEGGAFLNWHSGLAGYDKFELLNDMLKGYFRHHPEQVSVRYDGALPSTMQEDGGRPVSFEAVDEHYFVHCREAETQVFLRSSSIHGSEPAGWLHRHGRGKVICLTPSHTRAALLSGGMRSLLASAVEWCLEA